MICLIKTPAMQCVQNWELTKQAGQIFQCTFTFSSLTRPCRTGEERHQGWSNPPAHCFIQSLGGELSLSLFLPRSLYYWLNYSTRILNIWVLRNIINILPAVSDFTFSDITDQCLMIPAVSAKQTKLGINMRGTATPCGLEWFIIRLVWCHW